MPATGGSFTTLFSGSLPGFSPQGITVDGDAIYLTNGDQILSIPTAVGAPTTFATDPSFGSLRGITSYDDSLYVVGTTSAGGDGVWKVDTAASMPEPSTLIIWSLLGTLGIAVRWWCRVWKQAV